MMVFLPNSKRRDDSAWTAKDVMQVDVVTVASTAWLPEFERLLVDRRISGCPVVDDGKLVGVVSRSDIIRHLCDERQLAECSSDFYRDESGFHVLPLVSFGDVAERVGERIESLQVKDVMTENTSAVSPTQPLYEVATTTEHRVHRLPVTDEGRLVGIITTSDLVQLFADGRVSAQ